MIAPTPTQESTIARFTEPFIEQGLYLKGWSTRTVRTYRQGLAALRAVLDGDITKAGLQTFVVTLRQRGLTPGGINMYARTVNSFLSWLHDEGHQPARLRVKLLPNPSKPLRTFTDADVRQLVLWKPSGRLGLRTWTLMLLLLDTGLRIGEALALERDRVNLDALHLRVMGKGSRERLVPISPEGRKHLYRLLSKGTSHYVFATQRGERLSYRNAYRDIKTVCRRIGLTGAHIHPHNFRHYFAVRYIRTGGDIYRLSRILGHSTISTTQIYLRSMNIDHLREGHQ